MKLFFLFLLLPMISCSTTKVQKPVPVVKEHWVKVSERPPTYCPQGVAVTAERSYLTGEHFEMGDAAGSRYFIPNKMEGPVSRKALVAEVVGAQSKELKREAPVKTPPVGVMLLRTGPAVIEGTAVMGWVLLRAILSGQIVGGG